MDNKKKQNYSGAANSKTSSQTTDSNRQKSSSDIQTNKHWPRNSQRRENPSTSARINNSNNNSKHISTKERSYADKRPRVRGYNNNSQNAGGSYRGACEDYFATSTGLGIEDTTFFGSFLEAKTERFAHTDYEHNSVCAPRSKKQNLNHLLNFYCTPREVYYYDGVDGNSGIGTNGLNQRHGHVKKHKYNKEQFLQANFQFVIKASAKRKDEYPTDTLIDWSLIEQINIHTSDEPQCPICLYPPVAAKITRCGHVYCWPCVLHYLSLSDKTWRKCPICYDAIHVGDLKSASIVQQQKFNVNSLICFRLMCRKKGSSFIEKFEKKKSNEIMEKYPYFSSSMEEKLFSKFILAKRNDVSDIIAREKKELLTNVDELCPEYVFIQQAIELLKERAEKLGDIEQKKDEKYKFEDNAQQATITNNIDVIGHTDPSFSDINQPNELSSEISSISNRPNKFEEDRSDLSPNAETILYTQFSSAKKSPTKFYYFYQSDDGQNIYLHPLNVKMLQACYGSLADAPPVIRARIIQKEQHSMDEEHRRKFTCLGHLPLTCQFSVVEIELQSPYITEDIVNNFKDDILFRKKERQRRALEERKREKHINAINERQMGKIIADTANINITSPDEFPTCGFEESLASTSDFDLTEDGPSTSKGCRTKTISTSSAGSCSYSAIALHCKKEQTPWHTLNAAHITKPSMTSTLVDQTTIDEGEASILSSTTRTNLGDICAQALSQKKEKSNKNSSNKKSKKSKKMIHVYSTGMNFGGN